MADRLIANLPTYMGDESGNHSDPRVPVLAKVDGDMWLRVILGAEPDNPEDDKRPDILIERRRSGWLLAIAPNGNDPGLLVYINDDGRCFHLIDSGSTEINQPRESGVDAESGG